LDITGKLKELGLELPSAAAPVGNYKPAKLVGNLAFTAGQTARIGGVRRYPGLVGSEVSEAEAYLSARDSMLNCLACLNWLLGDLDRVETIVKVTGFVACAPGFQNHPAVVNGASDLLGELFGDAGNHARSAVGVSSLPGGASVEIELIAAVR
jgi:enamine deaminase RidA (YjgF/YER057c/UK114 family)